LFLKKKNRNTIKVIARNQANQSPMEDCAKACTELDDAAAGQERSKNGQPERGEDQPHIPHLQHPALLLHHYPSAGKQCR